MAARSDFYPRANLNTPGLTEGFYSSSRSRKAGINYRIDDSSYLRKSSDYEDRLSLYSGVAWIYQTIQKNLEES